MPQPRVITRDRLPSATPSSFSNYSGTCGFTTNYTAGLTPPFTPSQQQTSDGLGGERGTSNYYSYWEDTSNLVAQSANATAQAATALSNNPTIRNLSFISASQSSQTHPATNLPTAGNDSSSNLSNIRGQQNSMNTGRLATELSQNEVDSSFEYLNRLNLRCRSVPLLAIYIKNEPDELIQDEELILVEPKKESQSRSSEKELITFIDFLNESNTSNEKVDQLKEEQQEQQQPQQDNEIRLEKIDSEDGYADVESESEIMNFSNRQQTIIKRDKKNSLIELIKDEQDNLKTIQDRLIEKVDKNDFLIESNNQFNKFEEKENRSPISNSLEIEEDEVDDVGNFPDNDDELIKLLPSTPSTYSLFQKLMNKHGSSSKEGGGGNSNQNTLRKHSSGIECQNQSNTTSYHHHKHHHRRKKDEEDSSLVVLDAQDDTHHHDHHQSNQQQSSSSNQELDLNLQQQQKASSKSNEKNADGNEKRTRQSKKIKDKQKTGAAEHHRKNRSEEAWSELPNSDHHLIHYKQQTELIKNEHRQASNNLPFSRSMQLCQANSFDQGNELNMPDDRRQKQLNARSNSKESVKSPKLDKKKRKFSKKALHLLKVNHFRKSKSEEASGKELESLASKTMTMASVCKARSYNYNLIKNMNEYNLSQQSSVFNSASNSYEENYHLINLPSTVGGGGHHQPMLSYSNTQQQQQQQQKQQTHLNQHNTQYLQFNQKSSLSNLPSNLHNQQTHLNQTASAMNTVYFDQIQTNQPLLNNEQIINDDTRLFAVHVHNTDRKLKSSKGIVNPFIRLHVVNIHTGEYILKSEFVYQSQTGENAGTYVGSLQGKEYIQPIKTQPCDLLFKFRYPKNPFWEELLILNETFDFLKQNDVILFFEVSFFFSNLFFINLD